MRKSAPPAECDFYHTLKMSLQSSKNYIHNCVTGHPCRLHIDICPLGVIVNCARFVVPFMLYSVVLKEVNTKEDNTKQIRSTPHPLQDFL
jgi:hypothetical protein